MCIAIVLVKLGGSVIIAVTDIFLAQICFRCSNFLREKYIMTKICDNGLIALILEKGVIMKLEWRVIEWEILKCYYF